MKKILFCLLLFSLPSFACTDLQLHAADGVTLVGRTMDFDRPLHSALAIYPRGERRQSLKADGTPGLSWVSRYAYAGMNELGNTQMFSDGINDQGLALEDLWLAETQYPTADNNAKAVVLLYDLPAWILGNCATVAEVKQRLPTLTIWANKIPVLNSVTPLHFAIHDRSGANIVVEFLHGQVVILDNPVGVLTNSPPFAWQLTNLRNYSGLSATNHPTVMWGNQSLSPTGPGSGLLGMPGDYTPVSRFVRAAVLVHATGSVPTGQQAQFQMMHLLNNLDVPYDAIVSPGAQYPGGDYTQWSMLKNLSSLTIFIRPFNSMAFYQIDLATVFADSKAFHSVALVKLSKQDSLNVTGLFQE